jgi:hypothetical protein
MGNQLASSHDVDILPKRRKLFCGVGPVRIVDYDNSARMYHICTDTFNSIEWIVVWAERHNYRNGNMGFGAVTHSKKCCMCRI